MSGRKRTTRKAKDKTPAELSTPKTSKTSRAHAGKENAPFSTAKFKNFMEMCLTKRRMSEMRKRLAGHTPPPLPGSFTPEERHAWIQNYIDSVHSNSVNRVDYAKPPQQDIISTLPETSFMEPVDEEARKVQFLLNKFKEPHTPSAIIERVDYSKEDTPGGSKDLEKDAPMQEDHEPDDETDILGLQKSISYEEFCRRNEDKFRDARPSTSTQVAPAEIIREREMTGLETIEEGGVVAENPEQTDNNAENKSGSETTVMLNESDITPTGNWSKMEELFVTKRTPARLKNQQIEADPDVVEVPIVPVQYPVVEIEDSDNENDSPREPSVLIVAEYPVIPSTSTRTLRSAARKRGRKQQRTRRKNVETVAVANKPTNSANNTAESAQNSENNGGAGGLAECPICMEPLKSREVSATICGHIFCTVCIKSSLNTKKSCPTCRKHVNLKKIHPLYL